MTVTPLAAGCALLVAILTACGTVSESKRASTKTVSSESSTKISAQEVWSLAIVLRNRESDATLSSSEKELRHFDVRISDLGDEIEVRFLARFAEGEDPSLGGRSSLGRDIAYMIRKSDGKLLYSHGFK